MKPTRSMDEAITAARKLRSELTDERPTSDEEDFESRLKVVVPQDSHRESTDISQSATSIPPLISARNAWVRHTIGLREATSLKLRDAAEVQKRKSRYGTLGPSEPANEQEIADLGIRQVLEKLGLA